MGQAYKHSCSYLLSTDLKLSSIIITISQVEMLLYSSFIPEVQRPYVSPEGGLLLTMFLQILPWEAPPPRPSWLIALL